VSPSLHGKKLGLLLTTPPGTPGFQHGVKLAEAALAAGAKVYLYCIDEAVTGVTDARLQTLRERGLHLFGCAYAAQRRRLPLTDAAAFGGLGVLSDLVAETDRFLSFA
jgi:sulfur relay (sulfurtransferase) complex TusBCD TusD component (DsrE family)